MRNNGGVAIALCQFYGAKSFGQRTDLVNLNEDGVCATEFDTFFKIFDVGNEEVVAYELAVLADKIGKDLPACPVVFGHTVFDGIDRIFFNEFFQELCLLFGCELGSVGTLFPGIIVHTVLEEFGGSAVESDGDVATGNVAGFFDSLDNYVECVFSSVESGSETAFVAYGSAQATCFQN